MQEEATVVGCGRHRVVLHITKKEWLEHDDEYLCQKYFRAAVAIMQARLADAAIMQDRGMEKGICE